MKKENKKQPTRENLKVYEAMVQEYKECKDGNEEVLQELMKKADAYYEQFEWCCSAFEENGKKGVKDPFGEVIVPAEYEDVWDLPAYKYMDIIPVIAMKDGLYGLISLKGGKAKIITDFVYDEAHAVELSPYTAVRKPGAELWGLVDGEGKLVIPIEMDWIDNDTYNNIIFVKKNGKMGVYDYAYDGFAYPEYDEIDGMGDGQELTFTKDGVKGYVDVKGKFYPADLLERFYAGEEYDAEGNLIYDGPDGEPTLLSDHLD